jgi:hypothetical protein
MASNISPVAILGPGCALGGLFGFPTQPDRQMHVRKAKAIASERLCIILFIIGLIKCTECNLCFAMKKQVSCSMGFLR